MKWKLLLVLLLAGVTTTCGYSDVFVTSEERRAAVRSMYENLQEPEIIKKRRLGDIDAKETLGEIMDAWEYHFGVNQQSHYLRAMGVTEEDGLPRRLEGSTLTQETMAAATKLAMYLKELYQEQEHQEEALKLTESEVHLRRLKEENEFLEKLNKHRATPKSLGKKEDGTHEIYIGGGYVHSSNNKRKLKDASLKAFGGACTDTPYSVRYAHQSTTSTIETLSISKKCTCDSNGIQDPGKEMIGGDGLHIHAEERWCKCKESTSTTQYYSYVAPKCDRYPALSSNSKCSANTEAFPKIIDCAYELILAHGFYITIGTHFSIGYGVTGQSSDMVAEFRYGLKANSIPRPCFQSDPVNTFPNVAANGDKICIAIQYIADKIIAMNGNDIAESMGGPKMKGSMKFYPLRAAYPETYQGKTGNSKAMKLLATIPLRLARHGADFGSASTTGIDFSNPVCIGSLWSKLKQGGGLKKWLQLAGATMAVLGADFCVEMPGYSVSGKDLIFGLKVTGTAFDKGSVSLSKFVEILPNAWNTIATDRAGSGIKDLMNDAFAAKPLALCGAPCQAVSYSGVSLDKLSLDSVFKSAIVAGFPDKLSFSIDVGEIVGKVAPSLMKGASGANNKLFKLPNMFASSKSRRLTVDHVLLSQDSYEIEIPVGKLDESHLVGRHLKDADRAYAFPANAYILRGSKCQFTYTGMPKKINCNLKLQAGPKVTLQTSTEVAVGYAIDGTNLEIISKLGFAVNLGNYHDMPAAVKTAAVKLNAIDVGGMIDDSLSQTVMFAPFSVNFPKGYDADSTKLFEVARVPVALIRGAKGICLSNMKKLIPEDLQDTVAAIAKTIEKVGGAIGGDVCGKIDKMDLSNGFSTNVDVELALFQKSQVDIYAIIEELSKLEPRVKTLMTIIDAVFGEPLKKSLNNGVKSAMPAEQQFKISMGILIAQALKKAKAGAKAMVGSKLPKNPLRRLNELKDKKNINKTGRRLSQKTFAAQLISADGMFNLGGIPRSSKPGSKNKGDPNAEIQTEISTESTVTSTDGSWLVWVLLLLLIIFCVAYKKKKEKKKKRGYKPVKQSEEEEEDDDDDDDDEGEESDAEDASIRSIIIDKVLSLFDNDD